MATDKQPSHWFERGAAALARYRPDLPHCYACPLCLTLHGAPQRVTLTIEDVPPKSLGGKPLVLTCRSCNSRSGHALDIHMLNYEALFDFAQGTMPVPRDGQLRLSGLRVNVAFQADGETVTMRVLPDGRNNRRGTAAALDTLMNELRSGERWREATFNLTLGRGFKERAPAIGWLRSAYLVLFARLGYAYIARPDFELVRRQIADPDSELLEGYHITDTGASVDARHIIWVEEPTWLAGSFAVQMGRHIVLLPGVDTAQGFFERLQRQDGEAATIRGDGVRWPRQPELSLDFL